MSTPTPPYPPTLPVSKDRRKALVVYGWLLVVIGAACALFGILFVVLVAMVPGASVMPGAAAFNALMYSAAAAAFVALGVGSIRARRWARTLLLIVAWVWLATGALSVVFLAVILPRMFAAMPSSPPAGALSCVMVGIVLGFGVLFLVLPLILLLFYRRRDVRETVETASPPDWSDRLPPNLLGIVIFLVFGAVCGLMSLVVVRAVPFFGTVLTGEPAILLMVAFCALSLVLAALIWRQSPAGWWGLILLQALGLAHLLTLRNLDIGELYRASGYPEDQVRMMNRLNLFGSPLSLGVMAAAWLGFLLFLLYIRKDFVPARTHTGKTRRSI